jgi:hypothetical protein
MTTPACHRTDHIQWSHLAEQLARRGLDLRAEGATARDVNPVPNGRSVRQVAVSAASLRPTSRCLISRFQSCRYAHETLGALWNGGANWRCLTPQAKLVI